MHDLTVVVLTIKRPSEQYLYETLRSMRSRDPRAGTARIIASVGSSDPIDRPVQAEVSHIPECDISPYAKAHGAYKLTANLLHAVRLGINTGASTIVITEDDLQLTRNWLQRCAALASMARTLHPEWMITACTSHGLADLTILPRSSYLGDQLAQFRDPAAYWGNQCMIFPRSTLLQMADHLQKCKSEWSLVDDPLRIGASDFKRIGDQAVKNLFVTRKLPLLASIPSLAKHVGRINSWQGQESVAWRHATARFEP
jgi:hypothetical protein